MNEALREFDELYEQLDGLITIKVGDLDWVYRCGIGVRLFQFIVLWRRSLF